MSMSISPFGSSEELFKKYKIYIFSIEKNEKEEEEKNLNFAFKNE